LWAQKFYELHGRKTIVLARFVPIVRTFAPIAAGAGNMPYRVFFTYNVIGGAIWATLASILGYLLGGILPKSGSYEVYITLGIVILSFIPPIAGIIRDRYKKHPASNL
jgi:membrane-associated protein